jgi:hypothetical protein
MSAWLISLDPMWITCVERAPANPPPRPTARAEAIVLVVQVGRDLGGVDQPPTVDVLGVEDERRGDAARGAVAQNEPVPVNVRTPFSTR